MSKAENDERNTAGPRYDNAGVLIVEQEPQTMRVLLEVLARRGIGVRLAATKKAALDALDRNRCDLAFLSTPPAAR